MRAQAKEWPYGNQQLGSRMSEVASDRRLQVVQNKTCFGCLSPFVGALWGWTNWCDVGAKQEGATRNGNEKGR